MSDRYESEPNLGIDLVCSKITEVEKTKSEPEGKVKEQTFVLIGSKVSKPYESKLLFYQFYLSIEISSGALQIIFAIPSTKAIKEPEKKFFEQNGIGLFLLKKNDNGTMKIIEEVPPKTLRKRMENDIEKMIDDLSKHYKEEEELGLCQLEEKDVEFLKKQKEIIAVLADRFIEDALGGIVGLTKVGPEKFEKKYLIEFDKKFIDTKLLELISDVEKNKNIPYGKKLVQKIDEQCFEKKDEFDFSYDVFSKLWKQYFNKDYSKRLKINEPILKHFFPKYRDHFIHQFQDFLFGLIIISKLVKDENAKELSKAWLLASSLHDFSYPIQKYDDIVQKLTSDYFPSDIPLGLLALKDKYMEKELYCYAEYFIEYVSKSFSIEFVNRGTEGINKIREFVYRKITEKRNHGAISYLALLTKFEGERKQSRLFKNVILPAGVGILLHDEEIWKPLSGMEDEDKAKYVKDVNELKPLPKIIYDEHPLVFLMTLVDNTQDWGRHYVDEQLEQGAKAAGISLKDILIDCKKVQIQVYFDRTKESHSFMNYKKDVLDKICKKYLKSQDIKFIVEYWDRGTNEKTELTFEISS